MQEKRELIEKLQEALDIHQEKKDGKHYVYEKCAVGEEEYSRMSEIRHTEPVAPITIQTIAINGMAKRATSVKAGRNPYQGQLFAS